MGGCDDGPGGVKRLTPTPDSSRPTPGEVDGVDGGAGGGCDRGDGRRGLVAGGDAATGVCGVGAKGGASMSGSLHRGSLASLMVEALKHKKRATSSGLLWLTCGEPKNVGATLHHLVATKRVISIGTVQQARMAEVEFVHGPGGRFQRHDAQVFALAGETMLPARPPSAKERAARSKSSGIPAGKRTIPAYRWFL